MAAGSRLPDAPPASLEVVRRKAMVAVHTMERETDVFLDRCTAPLGEADNWLRFAQSVCEYCGKKLADVRDFKQFDMLLIKLKDDIDMTSQIEYRQLKKVCERGRLFDYISFRLRNDIAGAHNNLLKYCLSFEPDFRQYDLNVVTEFENGLIEWNTQIINSLSKVDQLLDDADLYKTPMTSYLSQFDSVTFYMVEVCRTLQRTAEPLKRWVTADAAYATKVQTAINAFNRRKLELRDLVHQVEFKRDQLGLKLKRRAFVAARLQAQLVKLRDDRRLYENRKLALNENRQRAEAEMQRKEADLEDVMQKLLTRTSNSPTVFDQLTAVIETLRCDIWSLEAKLETMDEQAQSLGREQHTLQKYINYMDGQLDDSCKAYDQAEARVLKLQRSVDSMKAEERDIIHKVAALKRLREVKLSSDTVKKIFYYGYVPGETTRPTDELEEAFKITAVDVGKDWTKLYQHLPFVPARDPLQRTRDLEVIDRNTRRMRNCGFRILTTKCLEKWRRVSEEATLYDLLTALKTIRKLDTVRKILRKVVADGQF